MKESVRKTLMFLMAVGFLTGFALLLYPMFSNMWNEYNSRIKFEEYQHENAERAEDAGMEKEWEKAAAYNEQLQPIVIPDSFVQAEQEDTQQDSAYMSCLNQNGDGMMGYLSIPKIGETIPIYHTSKEEVLQKGAGHIQGSSLPIGGKSTHASIAAHRGIPGMSLFTDLDLLEEGDQFYLYILDDILAYEVDQIETVMPEDTEILNVEEGKDYVTLVTCTPYGVNTQRLLVRGHRVPYVEAQEEEQEKQAKRSIHTNYSVWIVIGLLTAAGCIVVCRSIIWLICVRRKDRDKENHVEKKEESKKKRGKKKILSGILILVTGLFILQTERTQGAQIPVTEPCSITFEIPDAYCDTLKDQTIELRLYRVADITETGKYQDREEYSTLHISDLSTESPARAYKQKAKETAEYLGVDEWKDVSKIKPDVEMEIKKNQGMQKDLLSGVYLVCMKPLYLSDEGYQADPYLITLPGFMENVGSGNEEKYYWTCDAVVDLKLARKVAEIPPTPEEVVETPPSVKTPLNTVEIKTGDENNWEIMLLLFLISGSVLLFIGVIWKKCREISRERKNVEGIANNLGRGRKV